MGRHQHHLRLPEHLYLSPPTTPPPSNTYISSFLSVRSAVTQTSSVSLFQETSVSARAVGDKIPGFKTSAAFLTTLRANLAIDLDSAPPSLLNTPDSLRPTNLASSTGSLPLPSPLAYYDMSDAEDKAVQPAENSLADIPQLTTQPATSEDDKVEALKLVADSVAQQRQYASRAMIFHPSTLAVAVIFFGVAYQYLYKGSRSDWAILSTTFAGTLMAILISVRNFSGKYIDEAESVGTWGWLEKGRDEVDAVGKEDEILLSRYGQEPIGALVVRGVRDGSSGSGSSSPKKRRQNSGNKNAPVTGQIRGFTTINRYRRKGIGTELLEEAIKICQQKGWSGPEFASDHANSARKLWATFNGSFNRREREAQKLLEKVKDDMGVTAGGRKGKR